MLPGWKYAKCHNRPNKKLQRKIGQMSELKCIPGDPSFSLSFFISLSLWPYSSRLPHRSCLPLHFSSNCRGIFWPDAGPSVDNTDQHLWLFRIGELKTLNVEILSSYRNSLTPWQNFWQSIALNLDIKRDTEMMIEKISTVLKARHGKFLIKGALIYIIYHFSWSIF